MVDKTESRVIEAFLCLVVKLSEASFRPMFLRVSFSVLSTLVPRVVLLLNVIKMFAVADLFYPWSVLLDKTLYSLSFPTYMFVY